MAFLLAFLCVRSGRCDHLIALTHVIRGPYALDTEAKGPGDAICQANPDSPDLLAKHLGLRLDNKAVVRTHEIIPLDQYRLPLAGPPGEQPMLVQIRGHHGLGLYVYEVAPLVGADAEREIGVHVDVEEGLAEDGRLPVEGAPGGVARALDIGPVGRELGRYGAVEVRVPGPLDGLGGLCRLGDPVESDVRVASDVLVAQGLAGCYRVAAVEVVEGERARGAFDAFEIKG